MSLFRSIASFFIVPCDERHVQAIRGKDRGVIVRQPEEFVGQVKDAHGNHFAWVRADGGWDTSAPLTLAEHIDRHGRKTYHIENDVDVSFETMKRMQEPVKLSANLAYTAYGIFEKPPASTTDG